MIVFKGDLLGRLRIHVVTLPKAARRDVTENDIGLIQSQLERCERRLVFWYALQWRLEGLHIDDNRVLTFQDRSVGLTKRGYALIFPAQAATQENKASRR